MAGGELPTVLDRLGPYVDQAFQVLGIADTGSANVSAPRGWLGIAIRTHADRLGGAGPGTEETGQLMHVGPEHTSIYNFLVIRTSIVVGKPEQRDTSIADDLVQCRVEVGISGVAFPQDIMNVVVPREEIIVGERLPVGIENDGVVHQTDFNVLEYR